MKKTFLALPLAILLVNCSSTRNTSSTSGTSANSGINASASTTGTGTTADATTSGSVASSSGTATTTGSASTTAAGTSTTDNSGMSASSSTTTSASGSANSGSKSGMASASWNNSSTSKPGAINWDVYDPNNYMQNPEKYLRPDQMTKAGGWTYNKDWRRNTNFTPEAVGQWQLVLTPEVAANWLPDTRRPETYASFWTPEAVMARYQANMAAAARTQDSIAALNATANINTGTTGSTGRRTPTGAPGSEGMTAATNATAVASGSGTTGTVGTGGTAATTTTATDSTVGTEAGANSNVTIPFALTAVNGNNFMLPTLNMYIDNGSFTAYTGCNSAVGSIVVNGSQLHFDETTPSTNVECIGGFDQAAFMDRLRRADSYDVTNNQFRIKQGDQVLMIFSKNAL
ncbi:META domain-containing protein [Segetibacter sp.]|jgi:heat shock protein HslJ|uniref:META domain-containing protein n=1 Tax=Segetibacter sp. TaxID=2231182 RepID=UPI00261FA71C|nr:META domain-containing protein [Segetibacter sp.]MCW3080577.1 hypothetical protein [Segetibacter sp.]